MLFLEDATMSGFTKDGCKLTFTACGRWSAPDIIRGVATIISQKHKGRIDAPLILEIMSTAEKNVVDMHGEAIKIPQPEPEIDRAKSVADMKADLAKPELKHKQWRAFVLGWSLCAACMLLIRWIEQ